mgnify:CR=1 FL=1
MKSMHGWSHIRGRCKQSSACSMQELAKLTRATVGQGGGGGGGGGLPTSSLASAGAAHDVIPMDALGEPYQRLARNNKVRGRSAA